MVAGRARCEAGLTVEDAIALDVVHHVKVAHLVVAGWANVHGVVSEVLHGAAGSEHVTLVDGDLAAHGEEHLRQLRGTATDLGPGLLARALVGLDHVTAVDYAELVRVCAVRERMHFNVLSHLTCGLKVL